MRLLRISGFYVSERTTGVQSIGTCIVRVQSAFGTKKTDTEWRRATGSITPYRHFPGPRISGQLHAKDC